MTGFERELVHRCISSGVLEMGAAITLMIIAQTALTFWLLF